MDNIQTGILCWKLIRFDNLDKTDSFPPAFLIEIGNLCKETYSLKLKSLLQPLIIFVLNSPKFLFHQFVTKCFHVYILKLINDICLDLVPCSCDVAKWLSCFNLLIKVFNL